MKSFIGGEAMCMYSRIMERVAAHAADQEMQSAVLLLRHLAYGSSPGASALTQPATVDVQMYTAPRNWFDGTYKVGPQGHSCKAEGSANTIFFGRTIFIDGGTFRSSRKYQFTHYNNPKVSSDDGKRHDATAPAGCTNVLDHSRIVMPLTADEHNACKLALYLPRHKDDVLLYLQKVESYQRVTLQHVPERDAYPVPQESFKFTFQL